MSDFQVIVADDEEIILSLFKRFFAFLKVDAQYFLSGKEAIAFAESNTKSLRVAIIDLNLFDIGGVELAKKLKSIIPDISIILTSGDDISIQQFNTDSTPTVIDACLKKPFTLAEIKDLIDNFIGK